MTTMSNEASAKGFAPCRTCQFRVFCVLDDVGESGVECHRCLAKKLKTATEDGHAEAITEIVKVLRSMCDDMMEEINLREADKDAYDHG